MKKIFESKTRLGYWMNEHGIVFCPPIKKTTAAAIVGHFALIDVDDIFAVPKVALDIRIEAQKSGFKFSY